ncbi:tandem ph domain containing protein [Anaeramoeba flamelloides]|uniref:Tandem ph domain containing protein n=1 Tax=Anaeramoeba flamelloides TaxID=1746091 RepID=A0ABQ8YY35_9EUKA|nr:tandem ph domain containing protein [Anaeramoeba flamelloides]
MSQLVKALFKFEQSNPDEISLEIGDVIEFIREIEDGWSYGKKMSTGIAGVYPSNYVQPITKREVPKIIENKTITNTKTTTTKTQTQTNSNSFQEKKLTQEKHKENNFNENVNFNENNSFMENNNNSKPKQQVKEGKVLSRVPPKKIIKEGWLVKKGEKRKNWKKRYFKLYPRSIGYYKKKNSDKPLGIVLLTGSAAGKRIGAKKKKEQNLFFLKTTKRFWEFRAKTQEERDEWVGVITKQILSITEETLQTETPNEETNERLIEKKNEETNKPKVNVNKQQPTIKTTPKIPILPKKQLPKTPPKPKFLQKKQTNQSNESYPIDSKIISTTKLSEENKKPWAKSSKEVTNQEQNNEDDINESIFYKNIKKDLKRNKKKHKKK